MRKILYFTATWCAPCTKTRPIVEELNKDLDIFEIIDVEEDRMYALEYNVKSVPTFIVLDNNKEVKRVIGGQTEGSLKALIEFGK